MTLSDVPASLTVLREGVCTNGIDTLTRGHAMLYYTFMLLMFWVVATPAVSLVFGVYLYISVTRFNSHYNEAFSSLKIEHYKNFVRLHITSTGDLEVYAIGVDKVCVPALLRVRWVHFVVLLTHGSRSRSCGHVTRTGVGDGKPSFCANRTAGRLLHPQHRHRIHGACPASGHQLLPRKSAGVAEPC